MSPPLAKRELAEDVLDLPAAFRTSLQARRDQIRLDEKQMENERTAVATEISRAIQALKGMKKGRVKDWSMPEFPTDESNDQGRIYAEIKAQNHETSEREDALERERMSFLKALHVMTQSVQDINLKWVSELAGSVKVEDDDSPPKKRARMGDEAETKPELPAEILRCPACNGAAFRDVVLKRCNHTFCRSCLDLRLSNRQRKCPACDEQFAKSDMQTFMLQ